VGITRQETRQPVKFYLKANRKQINIAGNDDSCQEMEKHANDFDKS
jgi:hypothetical protein